MQRPADEVEVELLGVLQLWRDQQKRIADLHPLTSTLLAGFLGPLLQELKIEYKSVEAYLKAGFFDHQSQDPEATEGLKVARLIHAKLHAFERVLAMLDASVLTHEGVLSRWFATNKERFEKIPLRDAWYRYVSDDTAFLKLIGELLACLAKTDKAETQ
jgi:hypothetical protein